MREVGEKEAGYLRRELSRGEFRRSVVLPTGLRTEDVKAVFTASSPSPSPNVEAAKPRKITVTAK